MMSATEDIKSVELSFIERKDLIPNLYTEAFLEMVKFYEHSCVSLGC